MPIHHHYHHQGFHLIPHHQNIQEVQVTAASQALATTTSHLHIALAYLQSTDLPVLILILRLVLMDRQRCQGIIRRHI